MDDEIEKKLLNSGTCPHCYRHILDIFDKDEKAKWVVVKVSEGGFKTSFYLPDLVDREHIPSNGDYGSISSPSEIPEELPDGYMWVCNECYLKIRKMNNRNKEKDKDKPDDERWIDFLDDWQ